MSPLPLPYSANPPRFSPLAMAAAAAVFLLKEILAMRKPA